MKFEIGPWHYRVRISDEPLVNTSGQPLDGLCCDADRVILISSAVQPRRRVDVLVHELRHAWQIHMGLPSDAESDANAVASFTIGVMRQLMAQGGEPALMSMGSDGVIDRGAAGEAPAPTSCQCGKCGSMFSPQQVVSDDPSVDRRTGLLGIRRRIFCEYCGHVMVWTEAANQNGVPTGSVIAGPRYLTGDAAQEFLAEHGEKFGVFV